MGIVLMVLLWRAVSLCAIEVNGLYQAEMVVTGQGEAERQRGIRLGLEEVLIKVSGDADLVLSPKGQQLLSHANDFVESYIYEDRMQGIPIHDEQGTRERSHVLRVRFHPLRVATALQQVDIAPWSHNRPQVVLWLGIQDSRRAYVLGADTAFGSSQREVLKSVARKRGMPVILPQMQVVDRTAITYDDIVTATMPRLRQASERYGAKALLWGTLVMDAQGYWTLICSFAWHDCQRHWQLQGVTFDVALQVTIERSAKLFATSCQSN